MNTKEMHDVMLLAKEFERLATIIAQERFNDTTVHDTTLYVESQQQWVVVLIVNGRRHREIVTNNDVLKTFK